MPGAFEVDGNARCLVQGKHGVEEPLFALLQAADMVGATRQRSEPCGSLGAEM